MSFNLSGTVCAITSSADMAVTVLACGLTTIDITYQVERVPGPNEKVVASGMRYDLGGPAANAARTVLALGTDVKLVTALGDSAFTDLVRDRLDGIAITDIAPEDFILPMSSVLVDREGRRAVISTNATGLTATLAPPPLGSADAVLVDGHLMDAGTRLASAARRAGIPTILDGGSYKSGTDHLLTMIDYAAFSADFRFPGGEDTLDHALELGCRVALQTHGGAPIDVATREGRFTVDVPRVDVVDTLGAGDVFHGALALAVARGAGVRDAVVAARDAATWSVQSPGAMGWAEGVRN